MLNKHSHVGFNLSLIAPNAMCHSAFMSREPLPPSSLPTPRPISPPMPPLEPLTPPRTP